MTWRTIPVGEGCVALTCGFPAFHMRICALIRSRRAALLARTAYAGARHSATATTKALLLERVAWADAKSGDLGGTRPSVMVRFIPSG